MLYSSKSVEFHKNIDTFFLEHFYAIEHAEKRKERDLAVVVSQVYKRTCRVFLVIEIL